MILILGRYGENSGNLRRMNHFMTSSKDLESSTKMECNFCKKILVNSSSLRNHKLRAAYCLKIQGKLQADFTCSFCRKPFVTKKTLSQHLLVCNIKRRQEDETVNKIIKELKEQIKEKDDIITKKNRLLASRNKTIAENNKYIVELETKISIFEEDHDLVKEIAKQPKSVTTNTNTHTTSTNSNNKILNIQALDLNVDKIRSALEAKFDENYLCAGQKGLAHFAVDNLLKDENGELGYFCTDPSRQVFRFLNSLGELQKDVKAKKLTNMLVEGGLRGAASKASIESWTTEDGKIDAEKFVSIEPMSAEIQTIMTDNSVFANELSTITIR